MWVMPRKLSRDLLVGTTAVYFGATNWIKVPAYIALGQFTAANMLITATLIPLAILSNFAGVALGRRVPPDKVNRIIHVQMLLVGLQLSWDASFWNGRYTGLVAVHDLKPLRSAQKTDHEQHHHRLPP